jgi:hypothetical protein
VGKDQTVPYGTDLRLNLFQAINCLATIIESLRDARGHHSTTPSLRVAGSEDEDSLSDVAYFADWLAVLSASEVGRMKRVVNT